MKTKVYYRIQNRLPFCNVCLLPGPADSFASWGPFNTKFML